MSDRFDIKSKSKPSIQIKGKTSKPKSKTNLSSYTPNKVQKPKENILNQNKINPNNTTLVPHNNNHYNINNNISININIEMPKNRNKSTNINKKKNQPAKKSISIKKDQLKNNNSLIFNMLKNYSNKNNSKKGPFHIRIKSANIGLTDFKYNNNSKNINSKVSNNSVVDANQKNNFSSTMNDFNKKSEISTKTSIEQKNVSADNIPIENKNINNVAKKNQNLSITTGHLVNPKIISNKSHNNNFKYKKNVEKKRGNFSPSIDRELLNKKQNAIFNYSTENRKKNNINNNNKTVVSEINNKTLKLKNNFGYMGSSQISLNNQISLKKKVIPNSKENNTNINSLNNNRKQNLNNNKTKSPIIKSNNKLKKIVKNINNVNVKVQNVKSPNAKNIKNMSKIKNNAEKRESKDVAKEKDENMKKEEQNKIEEEKKKHIEEEKIKNDQEENINEEQQKRNQMEEKKRKMNPSKSQNDIGSEFIKKNLEDKIDISQENLKPSDPASKKIRQIESICKKGFAGPGVKKTNQDNFFIYKNFLDNPEHIFLGVCDGHGMFGHDVSGYLVNHLPQNLNASLKKDDIKSISNSEDYPKISDITSLTFVQTNINIVNDDNVDSTFSGTTCSSLIFCPTKIISANVGDSRCVVGKFDGKNWKAKNLTRDHKPNEEDEKKRIIEKGGRIESYKDEDGEFVGPERVWLKTEDVPGLAMSRSFGDDVAHTVGVISQPEIFEYNLVNEDKFILLASDGIWEFISSDECVNIVKDYYLKDDIDGALSYLYKESSKRWIMEEEVIDDITLIIMFLN
jgi:serine/threonine protein phosphatase PrpC